MACCLMAPSHNLSQCWSGCMSTYGVTKTQWVNPSLFLLQTPALRNRTRRRKSAPPPSTGPTTSATKPANACTCVPSRTSRTSRWGPKTPWTSCTSPLTWSVLKFSLFFFLTHHNMLNDTCHPGIHSWDYYPGARPTKHISIEFEIRWKSKTL